MFYLHYTEKWIDEVIRSVTEQGLSLEKSRFMIAFFSSMDNEFVDYFRKNKKQISSFSGRNFHIFTPLIYEDNIIPDDNWRYMRQEFSSLLNITLTADPTFVFFSLDDQRKPYFFAGFKCKSFNGFSDKIKHAIEICIRINEFTILDWELSEVFLSENIISNGMVSLGLKENIGEFFNKSNLVKLKRDKLVYLRRELILETDAEVKFKLIQKIKELESRLEDSEP